MDTIAVIHFGGAILWQHNSTPGSGRAVLINQLIQHVLLEDRAWSREFVVDNYKLRWTLQNSSHFAVVSIYPKFVVWRYLDSFLKELSLLFAQKYGKQIDSGSVFDTVFDFDVEYAALSSKLETSEQGVCATQESAFVTDSDTEQDERGKEHETNQKDSTDAAIVGGSHATNQSGSHAGRIDRSPLQTAAEDQCESGDGNLASRTIQQDSRADVDKRPLSNANKGVVTHTKPTRRVVLRGKSGKVVHIDSSSPSLINLNGKTDSNATASKKKKPIKLPTLSDKSGSEVTAVRRMTEAELHTQTEMQKATYIKRLPNGAVAPLCEQRWDDGDANSSRGGLAHWLRGYLGQRAVNEADLCAMIPLLRDKLIGKNVAVEVTEHVCRSVEISLAGTQLGTFDSLHRRVQDAMTSALTRILQPTHEVNILRNVARAAAAARPYSIVFCGVNGVGKSTSLAKVAFWLKQNGYSLLIAAGDTFRHGAVEQLEVHGRCLDVPVFQMGYGSDPSAVAAAALAQAARQRIDVVMIDTAGRMQDHESRMRALAKLIHDNTPDLVLFVGEALVGNNGVDQLRKFNRCLVEYAPVGSRRRGIDGIVLTKFDTIDDKVGAALSMVYELGQPIVFVGVGQTYQDLKVIDPNVVVSALMK